MKTKNKLRKYVIKREGYCPRCQTKYPNAQVVIWFNENGIEGLELPTCPRCQSKQKRGSL